MSLLGDAVRHRRAERGLGQEQVAEELGELLLLVELTLAELRCRDIARTAHEAAG